MMRWWEDLVWISRDLQNLMATQRIFLKTNLQLTDSMSVRDMSKFLLDVRIVSESSKPSAVFTPAQNYDVYL